MIRREAGNTDCRHLNAVRFIDCAYLALARLEQASGASRAIRRSFEAAGEAAERLAGAGLNAAADREAPYSRCTCPRRSSRPRPLAPTPPVPKLRTIEQPRHNERRDIMTTGIAPQLDSDQETERRRDTAGVIAPPPLIYLGSLGIGFGLDALIGTGSVPSTVRVPIGAASIIAAGGLLASFLSAFRRAETPVDPYTPSEAIVTDGPYRLTRNPAYLGMALMYAGIAIVANAPWALVPLPVAIAIIDRGVIAREERYLERKFGRPYVDYKRRVRRWI
jgi:protein-S-isoprenylcysteine O-methyltransferase Ste14